MILSAIFTTVSVDLVKPYWTTCFMQVYCTSVWQIKYSWGSLRFSGIWLLKIFFFYGRSLMNLSGGISCQVFRPLLITFFLKTDSSNSPTGFENRSTDWRLLCTWINCDFCQFFPPAIIQPDWSVLTTWSVGGGLNLRTEPPSWSRRTI